MISRFTQRYSAYFLSLPIGLAAMFIASHYTTDNSLIISVGFFVFALVWLLAVGIEYMSDEIDTEDARIGRKR